MHLESGSSRPTSSIALRSCDSPRSTAGAVGRHPATSPSSPRCPIRHGQVARLLADSGVALTGADGDRISTRRSPQTDHNVPLQLVRLNRSTPRREFWLPSPPTHPHPFTPVGDGQLLRPGQHAGDRHPAGTTTRCRAILEHDHEPAGDADAPERTLGRSPFGAPAALWMLDAPDPSRALGGPWPLFWAASRGAHRITPLPGLLHFLDAIQEISVLRQAVIIFLPTNCGSVRRRVGGVIEAAEVLLAF